MGVLGRRTELPGCFRLSGGVNQVDNQMEGILSVSRTKMYEVGSLRVDMGNPGFFLINIRGKMEKQLRLLIIEDSENDALLLLRELRKSSCLWSVNEFILLKT